VLKCEIKLDFDLTSIY